MNPRAELTDLLISLPHHPDVSDNERAGREPLEAGTTLRKGDYLLDRLIGCGSFGLIYRATDSRIGQELAVKEFFPIGCVRKEGEGYGLKADAPGMELDVLENQFSEEFKVLERFERPGIVKVYDLFSEKGGLFLVMELLQGATLEDILEAYKTLEERLALWFIRKLVSTLETIHLSGLVHGDIKPENLFLTHHGQVILLDFGAVNHYLTKNKSAPRFLTPGYAPPEQYKSSSMPDPASDLYAVGATLYEVLTGSAPPDSVVRTKGARLPSPTRRGANVSSETVSALARTLALAREKRPASAHALLGLLPESNMRDSGAAAPWQALSPWTGHGHGICRLQITNNHKYLASADKNGQLRLWSIEQERCMGVIEMEKEVHDIAIHPDDKYLAVAQAGGRVDVMDFSSGRISSTLRQGTPPVSRVAFSPDGKLVLCGLYDGTLELRSLENPRRKKNILAHDAPINDISFSPSGRLVALASNDRSASIWDLKSWRRIRLFDDHHRPVQVARFTSSGRFLLTGGSDMSLRVFDVKRGDEFRRLKGHEAMVWDVISSDDDHSLLSCSADRTIRYWDMQNFRESFKAQLSDGWLCSMAYCPANATLFIAGMDKTIHRLRILKETKEEPDWN